MTRAPGAIPVASTSGRFRAPTSTLESFKSTCSLLTVAPAADVAASSGNDSWNRLPKCRHHEDGLVDGSEPTWRSSQSIALLERKMKKSMIAHALDDEADLVGMADEKEARTTTADAGKRVVDARPARLRANWDQR